MAKSYKSFIKEYSMGLQVPSTSFLKPVGSMDLQAKKKKEDYDRDDELTGKQVFKRPKHMPKDLRKAKKVDAKPNDGSDHTQPTTKYKGLAFTVKVPNYVDG